MGRKVFLFFHQSSVRILIFYSFLDASGVWKTSDSQPVDFSDFPTFNPNRGIVGSTIVLVLSRKGPILYPAPSHFSFIQSFQFLPICSIEAELGNNIQNMENCGMYQSRIIFHFTFSFLPITIHT